LIFLKKEDKIMALFGFIGVGNMGGALASAVCRKVDPREVVLADHFAEKAEKLANEYGAAVSDNQTVAAECKYIFLGVKPQMMAGLISEIAPILKGREHGDFILVTMAAGLSVSTIEYMCGWAVPVIRIMPNTPASVGEGMILVTSNEFISEADFAVFEDAISLAGKIDKIKEKHLDAASVISGCGPAFMYMFMEALVNAGKKLGLDEKTARVYAEQTMRGAATLSASSELSLEQLRINVCSPGGSTIEGVKVFEERELSDMVFEALKASYIRTKELARS
jgi:pyrroline-5-carboxylate reductase